MCSLAPNLALAPSLYPTSNQSAPGKTHLVLSPDGNHVVVRFGATVRPFVELGSRRKPTLVVMVRPHNVEHPCRLHLDPRIRRRFERLFGRRTAPATPPDVLRRRVCLRLVPGSQRNGTLRTGTERNDRNDRNDRRRPASLRGSVRPARGLQLHRVFVRGGSLSGPGVLPPDERDGALIGGERARGLVHQ